MKYILVLLLGLGVGAFAMYHAFPSVRLLTAEVTAFADMEPAVPDAPAPSRAPPADGTLPPQEPVPDAPVAASGAVEPGVPTGGSVATRDLPPLRAGYEPAQPGSVVPLESAPTPAAPAKQPAGSVSLVHVQSVGTPKSTASAATGATPAPIGPEPSAAEPHAAEPVAPEATAQAAASGDAASAPLDPEPAPSAVAPPDLAPQVGALRIPVSGIEAKQLHDTFDEGRGARKHEAIDILAPAGTPVVAVEDGRVVKLFDSERGGLTVYQFDPTEKYAYYYAHLQGYAPGVAEGKVLKKGDLVGYVGTTGNANPQTPHLHFAVFVLGPEKRWWQGTAVNPYPLLAGGPSSVAQKE